MARKAKIMQFTKFRKSHSADHDARQPEERDSRSQTLKQMARKGGRPLHHWTFKGWIAPSPSLADMMRSPVTAPPMQRGTAMLESGALAYRRLENGEVEI